MYIYVNEEQLWFQYTKVEWFPELANDEVIMKVMFIAFLYGLFSLSRTIRYLKPHQAWCQSCTAIYQLHHHSWAWTERSLAGNLTCWCKGGNAEEVGELSPLLSNVCHMVIWKRQFSASKFNKRVTFVYRVFLSENVPILLPLRNADL